MSEPPYIRIGSDDTTLGEVALNDRGEIEIVRGDRERIAHLLAGMFHPRYATEADLYRSLVSRLNNGYMWAHEVPSEEKGRQ